MKVNDIEKESNEVDFGTEANASEMLGRAYGLLLNVSAHNTPAIDGAISAWLTHYTRLLNVHWQKRVEAK